VTAVTHTEGALLRATTVNSASLQLSSHEVPLDARGNLLLRFRGKKKAFPYVSAADVLNGRVQPAAVRHKIVLVGTTALGTREVVATPLDTLFAGV
jgi:adenylate cyclase